MSGNAEFTTWLPIGISSRISDPATPTLYALIIAKGANPPHPYLEIGDLSANFTEFSRTVGWKFAPKLSEFSIP